MTDASPPRRPAPRRAVVIRSEGVSPRMRRITLGGEGLHGFAPEPGSWGPYVKLLIPQPGADPVRRTYSLRAHDAVRDDITVDIVLHEPHGIASSWALSAAPGDAVGLLGPGAVAVPPSADWVLLAGDQSALPAIAYTLERLPPDTRGQALLALDDPADRQDLAAPPGLELRWLDPGQCLAGAVAAADWPSGAAVTVWAGAEAAVARRIRFHARQERQIDQDRCAVLNYWKRGRPEGAFGYVE